jgi:hypothetical protein
LQRFLLDGLRFGMGDAAVGDFTWNQLSGLAAGLVGVALIWVTGRRQHRVTIGNDQDLGALPPSIAAAN